MNLRELTSALNFTILHLGKNQKPDEIPVLVTLSEKSMGARASAGVKSVGMGFDWETGQFRIEPLVPLVYKGNSLRDVRTVKCRPFYGRNYYFCPRCDGKVAKSDIYCRYCSQRLKGVINIAD